ASALARLAYHPANQERLGQVPGIGPSLKHLLDEPFGEGTRRAAASALMNLAYHQANQERLGQVPGIGPSLKRLLDEPFGEETRRAAANALVNLARQLDNQQDIPFITILRILGLYELANNLISEEISNINSTQEFGGFRFNNAPQEIVQLYMVYAAGRLGATLVGLCSLERVVESIAKEIFKDMQEQKGKEYLKSIAVDFNSADPPVSSSFLSFLQLAAVLDGIICIVQKHFPGDFFDKTGLKDRLTTERVEGIKEIIGKLLFTKDWLGIIKSIVLSGGNKQKKLRSLTKGLIDNIVNKMVERAGGNEEPKRWDLTRWIRGAIKESESITNTRVTFFIEGEEKSSCRVYLPSEEEDELMPQAQTQETPGSGSKRNLDKDKGEGDRPTKRTKKEQEEQKDGPMPQAQKTLGPKSNSGSAACGEGVGIFAPGSAASPSSAAPTRARSPK
ncbi:MAG: hypothetical protein K0U12_04610, partial [Gammaproteobacteria bacterium]|nr:hypothetical protein [Gammaproteobacteria bacterium]